MATILAQVGWRPTLVAGGYRTWRRHVTAGLYDGQASPLRLVLLDGYTGSAKTEILLRVGALGVQILDLEGLAGHRGSLFGALPDQPQPSQKLFETRLLQALDGLDPARPVLVEAESSKIGQRMVPPVLWQAMLAAPRIDILVPPAARAAYLVRAYGDIVADPQRLRDVLAALPGRHGRKRLAEWLELADAGAFVALAEDLMATHYDPAYAQGRSEHIGLGQVVLQNLRPADITLAAETVAGILRARF